MGHKLRSRKMAGEQDDKTLLEGPCGKDEHAVSTYGLLDWETPSS